DANVTESGSNRFSIHAVTANNFYREQNGDFLVSERFEAHTMAVEYRRGFKLAGLPHFELGGQVQFLESDTGVLNGFIAGFEHFVASATGYQGSVNKLRLPGATTPPLGISIV